MNIPKLKMKQPQHFIKVFTIFTILVIINLLYFNYLNSSVKIQMNKKHWNTVIIDGTIPEVEILSWIDHSYDIIKG
jgi:hypothetical protein